MSIHSLPQLVAGKVYKAFVDRIESNVAPITCTYRSGNLCDNEVAVAGSELAKAASSDAEGDIDTSPLAFPKAKALRAVPKATAPLLHPSFLRQRNTERRRPRRRQKPKLRQSMQAALLHAVARSATYSRGVLPRLVGLQGAAWEPLRMPMNQCHHQHSAVRVFFFVGRTASLILFCALLRWSCSQTQRWTG